MAKSKPKSKPVSPEPQAFSKVQAKAFRAAKGQPVIVRFSKVAPDIELDVASPHQPDGDTFRLTATPSGGVEVLDFSIVAKPQRATGSPQHLGGVKVEIQSGEHRYVDQIFGDLRPQRFRYHFYISEPVPDMMLCPVHGLVKAKNGRCPGKH